MVKIIIENLGQKELVISDSSKSALQHFHTHFIDWMYACGGKGRCTTCKMIVLKGAENLSSQTSAEKKYREEGLLSENERLACQVRITGDVCVRVPDDCKLPHLTYTK